jgi:hypothetical protein
LFRRCSGERCAVLLAETGIRRIHRPASRTGNRSRNRSLARRRSGWLWTRRRRRCRPRRRGRRCLGFRSCRLRRGLARVEAIAVLLAELRARDVHRAAFRTNLRGTCGRRRFRRRGRKRCAAFVAELRCAGNFRPTTRTDHRVLPNPRCTARLSADPPFS